MIIKSFEINKKKFDKQSLFLIYGENEGLKNEIIENRTLTPPKSMFWSHIGFQKRSQDTSKSILKWHRLQNRSWGNCGKVVGHYFFRFWGVVVPKMAPSWPPKGSQREGRFWHTGGKKLLLPPGKKCPGTRNFDPHPRNLGVRSILFGDSQVRQPAGTPVLRPPPSLLSLEVCRPFWTPSNNYFVDLYPIVIRFF